MEKRSYWRNYRCYETLYDFEAFLSIRAEALREAELSSNCSLRSCLARSFLAKSADRASLSLTSYSISLTS